MDNTQIKQTIEHFADENIEIRVRDIAYILLSKMFADGKTAFQCLFGTMGFEEYVTDDRLSKLEDYMRDEGFIKSFSTDSVTGGITFEENRREMEQLLAKTQQAMDEGLMEPKDGLKILADIRVKLNDKFKVQEDTKDRLIIVNTKFNEVCENCGHEIYVPTKEQLMEQYNLTEKQQ